MAELSDELLMAYADGALDADDRAAVEAAIQQSPEYQRKLSMFRATLKPIQLALDEDSQKERLVSEMAAILRQSPEPRRWKTNPNETKVVSLANQGTRTRPSVPRSILPAVLAASIAMLVGGGIGWYLRVSTTPTLQEHLTGRMLALTDDGLFAQDALRHLLEAVPSGVAVGAPLRDGQTGQLKASFTFRATNGFPCRRYEINDAAERRFAGFACRSMDGQWLVHSHVSLAEKAQKGKGFLSAAAEHDAALDAAIRASMSGDVLETGQEAQLIANRWKSDRR